MNDTKAPPRGKEKPSRDAGPATGGRDWSETLFLPKTEFPMRAGLPEREPELLKRWKEIDLYKLLRKAAAGREPFILHDGPPYANANIHIGTGLNKILKDVVVRSQQMMERDAAYVPGWDCHGLPIEWKIEEQYRAKGKNKDEVPVAEFRRQCREFADHWIGVQREEFMRLGVEGDWWNPYTTMFFESEARIAAELMKFAMNGTLYRGSKPVMWSVVEKTALAEAEVEYQDYTSDTVWVKFPVRVAGRKGAQGSDLLESSVVIWTTTPWTIPGNRAVAFSSKISYGLYEVTAALEGNWAKKADKYLLADNLAADVLKSAKVEQFVRIRDVKSEELSGLFCRHPLAGFANGYEFSVPMLDGDHVTEDAGTGFVHTAPGHGADDFDIWTAQAGSKGVDKAIPFTVDADGFFTKEAPGFEGKRVLDDKGNKGDANEAVIKALVAAHALIARGRLKHQYPHSWRSKKPIIFRNTPQWFIAMDKAISPSPRSSRGEGRGEGQPQAAAVSPQAAGASFKVSGGAAPHPDPHPAKAGRGRAGAAGVGVGSKGKTLRELALSAIADTKFFPPSGQNRLRGMIEAKPDWVISRQRAWGVPITVFVHKDTAEVIPREGFAHSQELIERTTALFRKKGADGWFEAGSKEQLLKGLVQDPTQWERVDDILDVWFESGSTHAFVLEQRPDLKWPADIYLEGSDQHRGWFHSSLLESCGTRGRAPYDQVLTHGFVMAEDGQKMSKSLGNVVAPQDVIKTSGADILRLWVMSSDYSDDVRVGPEILKANVESYRKLRNTIRWLLGNLGHFEEKGRVARKAMPELEQVMLHLLSELSTVVREGYAAYDFKRVFQALSNFCINDLSAFYFDVRKDALYCEPHDSPKRWACLTVLDEVFSCLTAWLAPMLVFTMEEAWLSRFPSDAGSVHLRQFPTIPKNWKDAKLAAKWHDVREVRRVVTGALELERAAKRIGPSLEASPEIYVEDPDLVKTLDGVDLAELCITSAAKLVEGPIPKDAFRLDDVGHVGVVPRKAEGRRCERSWRFLADVGSDPAYPTLSPRDAEAVRQWEARKGA